MRFWAAREQFFLTVVCVRSRADDDERPGSMKDVVVGTGNHVAILPSGKSGLRRLNT